MIVSAAVLPPTPLLLPGLTGQPVAAVDELASRCVGAVSAAIDGAERIVAVAAAPITGPQDDARPPTARYLGLPAPEHTLSVGHAVAGSMLGGLAFERFGVDASTPPEECARLGRDLAGDPRPTALLVMADGSARRSRTGPGFIDDDAFAVDDEIAGALHDGRPDALARLDPARCERLLIGGRAAWQVMAGAVTGGAVTPGPLYLADPYGVRYAVTVWRVSA